MCASFDQGIVKISFKKSLGHFQKCLKCDSGEDSVEMTPSIVSLVVKVIFKALNEYKKFLK